MTAQPALTICDLYKSRWQVELFFKWIKQHLRIKAFYGTSENAVKTQIWIAVSVYVLVAIIRKRLKLDASLYTLMQVFSVTVFEKASVESVILQTIDGSEPVMGKRGKTSGTPAFFSCADSASWILCLMCRRHPPFPR
jgi:transposase